MDRDGSGYLTLSDLLGRYDAKKHPKVLKGEMTEAQVLEEFLDAFESSHLGPENAQGRHDHQVSYEEFEDYYTLVSSSIDNDDYFILMMVNAWKLKE
jgi:hypothetical protein